MIRRSTWIVVGVFLLALAGLFAWQRWGPAATVEETPEAEVGASLFDLQGDSLKSMRIERVGEKVVEMEADAAGGWRVTWPADQPVDSAALESTLSQIAMITVVDELQNIPDLGAMGLSQPAYRLLLTGANGRQFVADVGNQTPTGSGYYVLSSDRKVYVVNTFSLDPILGLVDALPLLATETSPAEPPTAETPAAQTPSPSPGNP